MYIKLLFTSAKTSEQIFRIVTDIINTPSVTNITTLNTRATEAGYNSDLLQYLDSASEIIRTTDLVNSSGVNTYTKAHIARPAAIVGTGGDTTGIAAPFTFTLEQSVYDALTTKYYTTVRSSVYQSTNTGSIRGPIQGGVGNSLTGGTISSSQTPFANASTAASSYSAGALGTQLTVNNLQSPVTAGNTGLQAYPIAYGLSTNIFSAHFYITDKVFKYALVSGTSSAWPAYNSTDYISGIFSCQYTRLDNWNTDSNGILPVVFSAIKGAMTTYGVMGGLFSTSNSYSPDGMTANWHKDQNSAAGYQVSLRVYNTLTTRNVNTTVTKAFTINPAVAPGLGTRSSNQYWLYSQSSTIAASWSTGALEWNARYGPMLFGTANFRHPSADLTTSVFQMHPLSWTRWDLGAMGGGNITEQGNFMIFNGDFNPGDEFTTNSITYVLWPTRFLRVGFAIPKA